MYSSFPPIRMTGHADTLRLTVLAQTSVTVDLLGCNVKPVASNPALIVLDQRVLALQAEIQSTCFPR